MEGEGPHSSEEAAEVTAVVMALLVGGSHLQQHDVCAALTTPAITHDGFGSFSSRYGFWDSRGSFFH